MKMSTDVLVAGGGPAGVAAAVAAKRAGAHVLMVERYGFLGGTSTTGLYGALCGFYTSGDNQEQVIKGIAGEIIDALAGRNGLVGPVKSKDMVVLMYDLPLLKLTFDRIVIDSGINVLLHSNVTGVICGDGKVTSVMVNSKSGDIEVEADFIIDATGDADLAAMAGVPHEKSKDKLQPGSMMFKMANVDMGEVFGVVLSGQLHAMLQEAEQGGEYKIPRVDGNLIPQPRDGQVIVGFTRVNVDGTDVESLTSAEFEGRAQVEECARFLVDKVPGFKKAYIADIATQIGIRESRRVTGEHILTVEEVLAGAKFDDAIGRCAWPVEQHIPGTKHTRLETLEGDNYYGLPFRSLIPQGISNLLVAGRCSSATAEAQASSRVFAPSMAQGQAAGIAASMSVKEGRTPKELDINKLQTELRSQGAVI